MTIKPTLIGYEQEHIKLLRVRIRELKRELCSVESELIGAKVNLESLQLQEQLERTSRVVEYVTSRERAIGSMIGLPMEVGQEYTADMKESVRELTKPY